MQKKDIFLMWHGWLCELLRIGGLLWVSLAGKIYFSGLLFSKTEKQRREYNSAPLLSVGRMPMANSPAI